MDGTAPVQDLLERVSKTFRTACPRVTGLDVQDHRNTHLASGLRFPLPMNGVEGSCLYLDIQPYNVFCDTSNSRATWLAGFPLSKTI